VGDRVVGACVVGACTVTRLLTCTPTDYYIMEATATK
jgi:hypothetical protein